MATVFVLAQANVMIEHAELVAEKEKEKAMNHMSLLWASHARTNRACKICFSPFASDAACQEFIARFEKTSYASQPVLKLIDLKRTSVLDTLIWTSRLRCFKILLTVVKRWFFF